MLDAAQSQDSPHRKCLPLVAAERCEPSDDTDRWRVLVVDDDVDGVWSLATILELDGHEVRMAFDGASALASAKSFEPGLVILDIAMPGMDGYEVCRRLRAMPKGQKMVIAALTGFGQNRDKRRSRLACFDIHIVKPVDPSELDRLLTTLMPRPD